MSEKVRITIVGMGAIGTSLGMALKKAEPEIEITGHDKAHAIAGQARKRGAVDRTDWNLISACENADVTIITTPIAELKDTLVAAGSYFKSGSLVMDTASVKAPVLQWAQENLGDGVSFVGGSPILPGGRREIDPELFSGALFCLCPDGGASPNAVAWASELVVTLGAKLLFIDAEEHDGLMAAVGHLPILLAAALLQVASASPAWRESVRLAGDSFANATMSISGDAASHCALCQSNAQNIVRWLDLIQAQLAELRQAIVDGNDEALEGAFEAALEARDGWERGEVVPSQEAVKYDRGFRSLFLGKV